MKYGNNRHNAVPNEPDVAHTPQLSFDEPVPQQAFPRAPITYAHYVFPDGIPGDASLSPQEPFPGQEWTDRLSGPTLPEKQSEPGVRSMQTPPPIPCYSPPTPPPASVSPIEQVPFPGSYKIVDAQLPTAQQTPVTFHIVPEKALMPLLSRNPDVVRIEPYFKQPRPFLSRRRIFSGFMSFCIVMALLCVGSVHLVQSTGIVADVTGQGSYASIRPTAVPPLPEPVKAQVDGPAANIIVAATTTARYDPHTLQAILPTQDFTLNQFVAITFTVVPPARGRGQVVIDWYTNQHFFWQQKSAIIDARQLPAGSDKNGLFSLHFSMPAEGYAQLYWNNTLAKTLYFVVRP